MLAERAWLQGTMNGPPGAADRDDALVSAFRALRDRKDLDELLRSLPAVVRPLIRFDYLSVQLSEGPGTEPIGYLLHIEDDLLAAPCSDAAVDLEPLPPPEPPLDGVARLRIISGSAARRHTPAGNADRKLPWRSVRTLPLATSHRTLGHMTVGAEGLATYTEADERLLGFIADQVAVAVDSVLSHGERQREQERLALLLDVTRRAVSSSESGEVMMAAATGARRITRSDAALIALPHADSGRLRFGAIDFPSGEEIRDGRAVLPLVGTVAGHVFTTGRPWVGTADDAGRLGLDRDPSISIAGLRAMCVLPVVSRDRVLATLAVGRRQGEPYGQADITFLTQVADQLAVALDSTLAYDELRELKVRLAQEKVYLEDEIRSESTYEYIVGRSTALRRVLQQAETVAPTGSTVLIYGETGTGKELIARAIHELSSRSSNPFVRLNCAAIPTGLLESELFGHERGAFTGAIAQRIGRFELASTGTIFLDEVGEIPLELQTKLLRVLQEREFERLGSTRVIHTDARLVAATNRDLAEAVERQQFRADLFYRLNVFPIQLPALRQRPEDIPLLVRHFTQQFARRMSKAIETIPSETMEALTRYTWPGNIRELQNLIERAVILSRGPVLQVPIQDLLSGPANPRERGTARTMEEAERAHILATLAETGWVLSGRRGAATRLGLNRSTLQFRMKKLGIARPTI
jgi:formate hydrogenlyase transcriptional activator